MSASGADSCRIVTLTPDRNAAWDAFVHAHPDGTFFHLSGWAQVLPRAFGHTPHFLLAERGGAIEGVLPLGRVRSLLFGDALISTPFGVYGGVLAANAAARAALEEHAGALAKRLKVDYLELRDREPVACDWPTKELYYTFRKEISPDPEANLTQIPRKQRAVVRKGIAAGLRSHLDDGVDRLFAIYSESVRNLGTPVFPRRYFAVLREVFGSECEVQVVESGGTPVAAVMSFYFRDEVLPYYGGGTALARECYANDFMYWEVMCRAAQRGVRIFDYGRSKRDTGSYRFKTHWGFEPRPLPYRYLLVRKRELPDLSPANPSYQRLIAAWKRLPLPVTRFIGPMLSRALA